MKIPKRLVIDGLDIEVKICDMGDENVGLCRGDDCQILIASRLNEQVRRRVFWHELVHMIFNAREIPEDEVLDEERIARLIGPALDALFRYNAEIRWIDETS